jgi:myosin-5
MKIGLQTPRLKRLAEIVSQQAIAQQEKMEFGSQPGEDEDYDGQSVDELADVEQDHQGERPGSVVASAA